MSDLSVAVALEVCPGLTSLSMRWRRGVSALRCPGYGPLTGTLYDHFFSDFGNFDLDRDVYSISSPQL